MKTLIVIPLDPTKTVEHQVPDSLVISAGVRYSEEPGQDYLVFETPTTGE